MNIHDIGRQLTEFHRKHGRWPKRHYIDRRDFTRIAGHRPCIELAVRPPIDATFRDEDTPRKIDPIIITVLPFDFVDRNYDPLNEAFRRMREAWRMV